MPSQAYVSHLEILLADAAELDAAHTRLRTGQPGRQWGLGAINRAVVVLCVSAWEAYLEELVKEAIEVLRPAGPNMGTWPALKAAAMSEIGRFNNPNVENSTRLFASCIGLADFTVTWGWRNCTRATARDYLNDALKHRHHIAHGVNPRPTIHNGYSGWLPGFFRRLGGCTDASVRNHLVNQLHANPAPW
jgi:hypothetical protein